MPWHHADTRGLLTLLLIYDAIHLYNAMPCCRLLQRMLMDLHELRIVSGQALETWRYNWSDEEAIKDVSAWLIELKQSDEGTD